MTAADAASSQLGPVALAKRIAQAIEENDISRLALLLARAPAQAIDGALIPQQPPLHAAAARGRVDCLALLLLRGAAIDTLDREGRSALMVALESANSDCACELLKPAGVDVAAACANGQPLLHKAALRGLCSVVSILVERGAPIDATDLHGRTALHAGAHPDGAPLAAGLSQRHPHVPTTYRHL